MLKIFNKKQKIDDDDDDFVITPAVPTREEIACLKGNLYVLKIMHFFGHDFKNNRNLIMNASINGHLHILNWFKGLKCEFQYDEWTINLIIRRGKYDVLRWYVKAFGQKLKYLKKFIDVDKQHYNIRSIDTYLHLVNIRVLSRFGIKVNMKSIFKFYHYGLSKRKKINYLISCYYKTKKRYFKGYKKN